MSEIEAQRNVNLLLDADLLKRIDDFRFTNRLPSRTEAIRALIRAALDKKFPPKK